MEDKVKRIKVISKNEDNKIITQLRNIPKEESLKTIREKISDMTQEYEFVDGDELIAIKAEGDYILEDILSKDFKIYIQKNIKKGNLNIEKANSQIQTSNNKIIPKESPNEIDENKDNQNISNSIAQNNDLITSDCQNIIKEKTQNNATSKEEKKDNNEISEQDSINDTNNKKTVNDNSDDEYEDPDESQNLNENLNNINISEENKEKISKMKSQESESIVEKKRHENIETENKNKLSNESKSHEIKNQALSESQAEVNTSNVGRNRGENFKKEEKNKYFFFLAIINEEYSNKIKFQFLYKARKANINIKETTFPFDDITSSKMYFIKSTIKRNIHFYEVELNNSVDDLDFVLEFDKKPYYSKKNLGDKTHLITLDVKAFFNEKIGKNIFFNEENQKEKNIVFNYLIKYFKEKDNIWKIELLNNYIKNSSFMPLKDLRDIFIFANLFNNQFLDNNFKTLIIFFQNYDVNKFYINEEIKGQILILYNEIKANHKKEELYAEIWPFLLLSLIKINEKEKVIEIISIIENMKNVNQISGLLFSNIKKFIKIIPEVKDFFIYIFKFKPTEIQFIINNVDNYAQYINILINNIKYLNNITITIFPDNLIKQNIQNIDKELISIIKILKEGKNIYLNTYKFKSLFKNYLKILNSNEKEILMNFLKKNQPNDSIVNEIKVDKLKECTDNDELINTLFECQISFEILEESCINLNFENINNDKINKMKSIINRVCSKNKNKSRLYSIFFSKIKNLEELRTLWKIFGYIKFEKDEEINIKIHLEKFWGLYNKEKFENENTSSTFFHMFYYLKEYNINRTSIEFIIKIKELDNVNLIFKIYDKILQYENDLNNDEKEVIFNYLITIEYDKFDIYIQEKSSIIQFLLNIYNEKKIEVEDFYKESDIINGKFKIFNFLNKLEEAKSYIKNSTENFDKFKQSIEEDTINYNQLVTLNDLIKTKNFKDKLIYYNFNEREYKNFLNDIESKYKFIAQQKIKLEECKKYLDKFPSVDNTKIKNIIISKIRDSEKLFKKFKKSINENNFSEKLDKLYERALKFHKMITLKASSIFLNELENRLENEDGKIKFLENKINEMKKILSRKTIDQLDNIFLNDFFSLFSNEKELIFEIDNLKSYFKFKDDISNIEKYLLYNFKKNKIIKVLNGFIYIIQQYNLKQTEFYQKIIEFIDKINNLENDKEENEIEFKEDLEDEILEGKIIKIEKLIQDFESFEKSLNIKITPMDILSYIVCKFQENSLLKFLFELTINDLRDITNSLSGSSLNINDINDYQLIKKIIDILKEKNGIKEENEDDEDEKKKENNENEIILKDIEFLQLVPIIINDNLNGKTINEFKFILEKCAKNQPKLLILFDNKKGFESSKEDIRNIFNESIFEIYYDRDNQLSFEFKYNCRCLFKEKTNQKYFKELIVLQQLASLSQNKEKKDENEILNKFIDLIENIKDILSILDSINYKGFPQEFYYLINVDKGETHCKDMNVQSNNKKNIYEEKEFLKKLLDKINFFQIEAYKNSKFIKFYFGRQITMFNDYLKTKIGKAPIESQISNLIQYILGNKELKEPENYLYKSSLPAISASFDSEQEIDINPDKALNNKNFNLPSEFQNIDISLEINNNELNKKTSENINKYFNLRKTITVPLLKQGNERELEIIMKDMYDNVESYLEGIMKSNNITEHDIFYKSIIKNEKYKIEKYKGFYFTSSGNNIYKHILKFYHCLVGNDPPRYSLLLCNEETTLEEIMSFIYLAVFCPYHSLFIIAKPDRLNIDIIYEIEMILEKFHEDKIEINSYILFIFNDIGKSEIGNELTKICKSADDPKEDIRNKISDNEISTSQINNKDYYKNIEIVTSSRAGLGKTFYIEKKCIKENYKYTPFPIGGEVKRQTIMRRLKELKIQKEINYGLHLDFSDTKQLELFEDFIFSFLIQKFYSNNENIFCYENNVKIYIEIPNGFFNLMEKFKLFREFSVYQINKLPKYELKEKEDSFKDFEDMEDDREKGLTSILDIQKKNEKLNHNYLYKSDIQIVCNYLKYLEQMSSQNLYFYDLNEKLEELQEFNYYLDSEFITEDECNELLNAYFNKNNRSYHQINIYIKVLADQLRKFSINYYLMIENLNDNELPGSIRNDIIQAFMELTSYFTVGAFDEIVSEQNFSIDDKSNSNYNENEELIKAADKLSKEKSNINFNELNDKGFIFVNKDGQSFTIITCAPKTSEIYKKLDLLYNSGAKFGDDKDQHIEIPDYTKMTKNEEFLEIIKKIIDSKEDVSNIKKKLGSYVFNADNFFKMVQILIRLRTGIPVLIMGETGCGKTSLINTIAEINNFKMLTFNIHAGVNDNEIVQFMVNNNLLEESLGCDKFEDDVENLYNSFENEEDSLSITSLNISATDSQTNKNVIIEKEKNDDKLIIVFFDEFNTCNSLGLLTEIMCSKKCQGVNIKKNVVFAGACNPYRRILKEKTESSVLIKENSSTNLKLVYTVNPLTYTQLYYIFNFGSLSQENEKKYITGIVEAEIDEFVKDKSKLNDIKNLMIDAFIKAQSFIKEKNGNESVSMRETRKFMTIYKFMIKDFERKKKLSVLFNNKSYEEKSKCIEEDYKFYLDKEEFIFQKCSIASAIYICFYIRLSNDKDKLDFQTMMTSLLQYDFISYPNQLKDELIGNIKLEKGIAPNESLKLNLFICFVGILTKIAVFLVGPPGCSKSLCFNLLKKEMKGSHSKSKFWQEYPQLIVTSYQGSLTSTSKGIIDTFKDAEKKLKDFLTKNKKIKKDKKKKLNSDKDNKNEEYINANKGIIICVLIDEIGLCEISPLNPLKALHTYLEIDYKNQNIDEKLAFVGISNWKLDAAKMNRGIYLNVINPISEFKQMKETALQIANIYDKSFSLNYGELIDNLSRAIFNYNLYLKDISPEQMNFHGARDFYNLIKTTSKRISDKNNKDENEYISALFAIESNYNGISRNGVNSADWIKKEFKKLIINSIETEKEEFGIVECIRNNISDDSSRYLLLIMKSNLSQYLILKILKAEAAENKIIYYLGSLFEDDICNELYSAKAINKIKFYLEKDIILILKNLSTTYASLYDLLNQRFTYIKNQKYADISLGEVSNSTFVNNDLKIIVFIREEAVKEQDPPFLNRFEKYYISFDNILDFESKEIANKILDNKKLFKKINKRIKFNFENELINFYDEEIKSLISDYKIGNEEQKQINEENILDYVMEKISRTFPQELIAYLNHYRKKNKSFVNKVNEFYSKSIHSNLEEYITKACQTINIIYTFTPTLRLSKKLNININNEIFGIINSENIKIINVNLIKTERQFELDISEFYKSQNKLLIIHFEENDAQNLEFILIFLERYVKENDLNQKKLILILNHLKRKKEEQNKEFNKDIFVPSLSGFEQTFIDNLFGKDVLISDLMGQSIRELYNNKKLINIDELFKNELFYSFQKIQYSFQDKSIDQNIYINEIITKILSDENLLNKIKNRIINELENIQNKPEEEEDNEIIKEKGNIFDNIFENNSFESNIDFISLLTLELEQKFTKYLTKFIVNSEKKSILYSLTKDLPDYAKIIWEKLLDEFNFKNDVNNNLKSNKIKIWTKLNLPSIDSINYIKKIIENDTNGYIKSYLNEENAIRGCIQPADIMENEEDEEEEDEEKKNLINEFFFEENNDIEDQKYENAKEEIKKFFVPRPQAINFIKNQIEKDIFIKSFEDKNKEELLDLFFKDYYSQFITSILESEDILYYEVLKYLIELRFGKKPNNNSLIYYSKSILWTQIYKDEFIFLLKHFGIMKNIFPDLDYIELIKKKIDSKEVDYIISSHHPLHKKLIYKPFLLILDSFYYNLIELLESLNSAKVLEIINYLSEIVQNGEIYNSNLQLISKDFYRFKTLFISIKLLNEKNVYNKEDINLYINYIKNERKMINENKIEKVSGEIKKQIDLLLDKLPICEEKSKTIMKILISKYKEVTDIGCREVLCDIVLKDNNLILISNEFFSLILDKFSFTPDSLSLDNNDVDNPFTQSAGNYNLLKKINGKYICKILKENLKYIFKFKILQYYDEKLGKSNENTEESIKKEIEVYLGKDSLLYFKNAHNTLIEIKKSKELEIPNKNIKEVFCIVYCNIFLENFVKYAFSHKNLVSVNKAKIIEFLNEGKTEIKETFKLFILKELKTKYILERTEFLNINKWTEDYILKDLFGNLTFEKLNSKEVQGSLTNLFYGGYNIDNFIKEKEHRSMVENKYHALDDETLLYNIDLFINENLSTLKTEEGLNLCKNSSLMKCFYSYIKKENNFQNSTKNLIKLFFDDKEYMDKFSQIVKNTNYFEIMLYAYRFSIICSISKQNSIYSKMINEKCIEEVNNSYIPGADLFCDQLVESYFNMCEPISKYHGDGYCNGYYICDCGEYYFQEYCGVPVDISICANCHKKIGGLNEKLIIREEDNGEYKITRIYPDQKNKNDVESRSDLIDIYGEDFKNGYPYKIFADFEKEIMAKMNHDYKGILEQSYLFFIKETKKIRNLNQISFRLLNFIIYSNIYYSYKCGYITLEDIYKNKLIPIKEEPYDMDLLNENEGEEELDEKDSYNDYRMRLLTKRKEGIKDENSILEILNINWILLEKHLKEKNVESIQIFINSIFNDLFQAIKFSEEMNSIEQRNEFEEKINSIINNGIENYSKNSYDYQKIIEKISSDNLEPIYIILERNYMIDNVEIKYPYYYEFLSIPMIEENKLIEILKSIEKNNNKYPVLCSYLDSNKKNIEYLQTFSKINNFVNYTIEFYTNEISRPKAKSTKISDEIKTKNIPLSLLNDFLKAFNEYKLYNIADRYECHNLKDRFELREFKKDDYLSNFLIDNGVQDYGMQLAALYQKYISFQNSFLEKVIYNIPNDNFKLNYLKEKISEEINPQKANQYNIVSFNIESENYNSFLEMLLFYSYKDSFNEQFEFDFSKKDKIKYNLEEIEEQLEYILLPGKKKFNNKIEYVIYQFEGFRSQNSSILLDFMTNYPQKALNEEQKKRLYDFRSEQYTTDSIKKILFSIQLMITFYNEQPTYPDKNIRISETFTEFPPYFKIPDDTKQLFNSYSQFTISNILSVYEYFELLCFNEFKINIDPSYKQIINNEKIEIIIKYFDGENKNIVLNKLQISTAIRRFISRSLVGTREDFDVDNNTELFYILKFKEDCWNREIVSNIHFEEEIEKLSKLNIKVGEVLNLYDILGGDNILLGEEVKKKVEEEEEEEEEEKNKQSNKQKERKKKGKKIVF